MPTDSLTQRQAAIEHIDSLIQKIGVAMLTTQTETGLFRSRPMTNVTTSFEGDLWFFSRSDDARMSDIRQNPRVGIIYACSRDDAYLSLSGEASIETDHCRMEAFWKNDLQEWFPDGPDTEGLVLIRIRIDHAEYWDQQRSTMVEILKSVLSTDSDDPITHEEVTWPRYVTSMQDAETGPADGTTP